MKIVFDDDREDIIPEKKEEPKKEVPKKKAIKKQKPKKVEVREEE